MTTKPYDTIRQDILAIGLHWIAVLSTKASSQTTDVVARGEMKKLISVQPDDTAIVLTFETSEVCVVFLFFLSHDMILLILSS